MLPIQLGVFGFFKINENSARSLVPGSFSYIRWGNVDGLFRHGRLANVTAPLLRATRRSVNVVIVLHQVYRLSGADDPQFFGKICTNAVSSLGSLYRICIGFRIKQIGLRGDN